MNPPVAGAGPLAPQPERLFWPCPFDAGAGQLWPFVMLTLTCFGFDSARFGSSTLSTPFL